VRARVRAVHVIALKRKDSASRHVSGYSLDGDLPDHSGIRECEQIHIYNIEQNIPGFAAA
jgi:aspartate 1-decarboxylase